MCSVRDGESQWSHIQTQPSSSSNLGGLASTSGSAWAKQSSQLPTAPAGSAIPTPSLGPWMSLCHLEPFNQLVRVAAADGDGSWATNLWSHGPPIQSVNSFTFQLIAFSYSHLHLNYSTIAWLEPISSQAHPVLRMLLQRHFELGIIVSISQLHLHLPSEGEVSGIDRAVPLPLTLPNGTVLQGAGGVSWALLLAQAPVWRQPRSAHGCCCGHGQR